MRSRHRHWRISALGAVLCLLAALFAIEAKVGLYSPNGSVRAELSSTKLQAADATRPMDQALAAPAPVPHSPVELPFSLSFAALIPVMFAPRAADVPPAATWLSFSPPHFFRPPPRW